MDKIRVLQTIRQGKIGGGESHVLDLVRHINRDVFEPIVLSFTDGQMVDCLNEINVKNYVIHTEKPFDFTKWGDVKQLMKDEKIDLVHAHGTRANSNVFWASKKLNLPLMYTIHGWSFHDDQKVLVKNVRVMMERFLTRQTDLNISVSQSNQDTGKRYFKNFISQVVNNGINLNRFNPANKFVDIRKAYNVPENHTLIGYIARITKQKDPFTLLSAMKHVLDEFHDITLLIVGDGDLKEEAESLAASLGIQKHIIFAGYRTDIPDLLSAFDIYCLPSLWEGLPIGLMEAMAMKKAVVATRVDGSKEMIDNRHNGLLINPQDPVELAEALKELHLDKALRESLGDHALTTVKEKYQVEQMVKSIEKEYKTVLSNFKA